MSRTQNRVDRLRQMEWLYTCRAYTDREMAEKLGVNRSTVFRDRQQLMLECPLTQTETGAWRIERSGYISNLRVSLHEALALYLAARRTTRQTRSAQPHLASAVRKLAETLRPPMTARLIQSASFLQEQQPDPLRIKILETVTQAWVEGRVLRISYQSLHADHPTSYLVSPYLIEPSIWNEAAYLIGACDRHPGLTTFKIERIDQAILTLETFTIPADFDEGELLRFAWGIWFDDAPETVRLRFFPGEAARRLHESIWHPTQVIEELEDGGCTWSAEVSDWHEIAPWVRGWGSACEALEPEGLREAVAEEAMRTRERYEEGER